MIFKDLILARIDRPSQTILLVKEEHTINKLDNWIKSVNKCAELIDLISEKVERKIIVG